MKSWMITAIAFTHLGYTTFRGLISMFFNQLIELILNDEVYIQYNQKVISPCRPRNCSTTPGFLCKICQQTIALASDVIPLVFDVSHILREVMAVRPFEPFCINCSYTLSKKIGGPDLGVDGNIDGKILLRE